MLDLSCYSKSIKILLKTQSIICGQVYSVLFIYISILMLIPHCLDYCSFAKNTERRECKPSNLVPFFFCPKIFLTILGLLYVPCKNFRLSGNFYKNSCLGFWRDFIESIYQCGWINILIVSNLNSYMWDIS